MMEDLVFGPDEKSTLNCHEFSKVEEIINESLDYIEFSWVYIKKARQKGWTIITPTPHQLFIDIDSDDAYKKFNERIGSFKGIFSGTTIVESPSKSGLPHRHIIISVDEGRPPFTDIERVAWQSILGSDPVREFLSMVQIMANDKTPVLFSELP